ncbi:MAG: chemotaxis protein CheD [Silicimonas sp.]|nr:chemotaxis protein CheD [Silicimonas sp.]
MSSLYITQGEIAVGRDHDMVISTILGSCISICLWDPVAEVGGMNHLLLPDAQTEGAQTSSGAVAMDRLINEMMRHGAERPRLRAKLFGGSSMLSGRTDIGLRNAEFGRKYLLNESIPCDAESLGGTQARRLRYWPKTHIAKMRFVEEAPVLEKPVEQAANDVELF